MSLVCSCGCCPVDGFGPSGWMALHLGVGPPVCPGWGGLCGGAPCGLGPRSLSVWLAPKGRFFLTSGLSLLQALLLNLEYQILPMVVMKVVSFWLLGSREIYQKPLDASNVENTFAPANFGVMSSSVGSMYLYHLTALFRLFRLTHTLNSSLFLFSAGTMGAHKSVGSVTCSMIPKASMEFQFSFNFGEEGKWHPVGHSSNTGLSIGL